MTDIDAVTVERFTYPSTCTETACTSPARWQVLWDDERYMVSVCDGCLVRVLHRVFHVFAPLGVS